MSYQLPELEPGEMLYFTPVALPAPDSINLFVPAITIEHRGQYITVWTPDAKGNYLDMLHMAEKIARQMQTNLGAVYDLRIIE